MNHQDLKSSFCVPIPIAHPDRLQGNLWIFESCRLDSLRREPAGRPRASSRPEFGRRFHPLLPTSRANCWTFRSVSSSGPTRSRGDPTLPRFVPLLEERSKPPRHSRHVCAQPYFSLAAEAGGHASCWVRYTAREGKRERESLTSRESDALRLRGAPAPRGPRHVVAC